MVQIGYIGTIFTLGTLFTVRLIEIFFTLLIVGIITIIVGIIIQLYLKLMEEEEKV